MPILRRLAVALRLPLRSAAAAVAIAASVVPAARAQVGDVLRAAPTDALLILATPSIERLDQNVGNLITATEMTTLPRPAQLLAAVGLSAGIDQTRPAALMLLDGDMDAALPPIVAMLPVSDYGAMLRGFGAEPADGVTTLKAMGETVYARELDGGYALVGAMRNLVEGFDGDAANLEAHAARIGRQGGDIAAVADLVVIADVRSLGTALDAGALGLDMRQIDRMTGGMLTVFGVGQGESPLMEAFKRDARTVTIGLRAGGMGAAIDGATQFEPGSPMAAMATGGGSSTELLQALPKEPFLVTYSVDVKNKGMKDMLRLAFGAVDDGAPGEEPPVDGALVALIDDLHGSSGVIYPNPAGLVGGVIARSIAYYASDDPERLKRLFRAYVEGANGAEDQGVRLTTTYQPDAEIGGRSVDAYSVKVESTLPMQASPMGMLYGGQSKGPNGFVAAAKNGVYTTATPDPALMQKALSMENGGESLAADRTLGQVAQMLPPSRTAEFYLGVKAALDVIGPFMMGRALDEPPPADLAPVGIGVELGEGSVRVGAFAPAPVLKIVNALQSAPTPRPGGQDGGRRF